jgi:predicted amidophosphoribosyltransferase
VLIAAAAPKLAARFARVDVVVPIPPAFWRTLWRGFHPPDAWAKAAAHALDAACAARALRRIDSTRQMGASREARQKRKLFALTAAASALRGKHVLVVDDVTTSGATMRAAAAMLSACEPASLSFAALAAVR